MFKGFFGWVVGSCGNILHTDNGGTVGDEDLRIKNEELRIKVYPNPVVSNTSIEYELIENSDVSIQIFNYAGQVIENMNESQNAGIHEFEWNTSYLPSGIFFYRIETNGKHASGRIIKL